MHDTITILLHSLLATFISFGWCAAFEPKEIFGWAGDWMDERFPEWLKKPLYDCPKCNSFWVATIAYWLFWGSDIFVWLATGVAAIGIAAIVLKINSSLQDIADGI